MPTAQFINSVAANLAFWRLQTAEQGVGGKSPLNKERLNLFWAAEFGITLSATWRETAELLLSLRDLIDQGVYRSEWIPVLEGLIGQCDTPDLALKCRLLNLAGFLYKSNRQVDLALERLLEAEAIASDLLDVQPLARYHLELGRLHMVLRNHAQAEQATAGPMYDGFVAARAAVAGRTA